MELKKERCVYGHIQYEKRRLLFRVFFMVLLGTGVFFLGLCLNKWDKRNIFSVLAVLFVLPMARYLSTLLILLPFQTGRKDLNDKVHENLPGEGVLFSDYVFTLSEKVLFLSSLVITDHELIGLQSKPEKKPGSTLQCLSEGLKKRDFFEKVTIYKDEEEFLQKLKKTDTSKKPDSELLDFLKSLAV